MDGPATDTPDDFVSLLMALRNGTRALDDCPDPFVESLGVMMRKTREELREGFGREAAREANAPRAGDPAPDFALELLSPAGERTGELRRLSDHRGRPVALVFGSYT